MSEWKKCKKCISTYNGLMGDDCAYEAVERFEENYGTTYGSSMGDNYFEGNWKSYDKKIVDRINAITPDAWIKMGPKIKMQVWSFMYNSDSGNTDQYRWLAVLYLVANPAIENFDSNITKSIIGKKNSTEWTQAVQLVNSFTDWDNKYDKLLKMLDGQYQSYSNKTAYTKSWSYRPKAMGEMYDECVEKKGKTIEKKEEVQTVAETPPVVLPKEPDFPPTKMFTFNVEKSGIIINKDIGTFSLVEIKTEYTFESDEDMIPLDDEYVEQTFTGEEELFNYIQTIQNLQSQISPNAETKKEILKENFNSTETTGEAWKNYNIDSIVEKIKTSNFKPDKSNPVFENSLRKILLWIKTDKDIDDYRKAAYLLATGYAEAAYSLKRWEADYVCTGKGIPYGPGGPCNSALNWYRKSSNKKVNYYNLGTDTKGFPYFGRGFIQLTGKGNYKTYGDLIGVDLVANGDLALEDSNSYKIAVVYMRERKTFKAALSNDLTKARKSVNGGTNGLNEVNAAYEYWQKILAV